MMIILLTDDNDSNIHTTIHMDVYLYWLELECHEFVLSINNAIHWSFLGMSLLS